jgi:uncharacterized RDD family membrane protein YckC
MTQQGPTPPGQGPQAPGSPQSPGGAQPPGSAPRPQPGQQAPPPVQSPTAPKQLSGPLPRAEFVQRLGAFGIDLAILVVAYIVLNFVVGAILTAIATSSSGGVIAGISVLLGLLLTVLIIALQFLYFYFLERQPSGQTFGDRVLGIRVVDFQTGGPLTNGQAAGRSAARYLSSFLMLGYLWMLWDPEEQTWHDKLARTTVVPVANFPI